MHHVNSTGIEPINLLYISTEVCKREINLPRFEDKMSYQQEREWDAAVYAAQCGHVPMRET